MSLLAFAIAAVILAITPGPGIAYVVARTAAGGRPEGLASCVGTGIGGMLHVFAAALGLSLMVAQSAAAFSLVKYLGAAYLVYLGIRCCCCARIARSAVPPVASRGARRALLEGVVVEGLNVKTALFFLAFLPQFVVTGSSRWCRSWSLLGRICVALNTLVDVLAVFAAGRLLKPSAARAARAGLLTDGVGRDHAGTGCAYLALARRETLSLYWARSVMVGFVRFGRSPVWSAHMPHRIWGRSERPIGLEYDKNIHISCVVQEWHDESI